MNCNEDLIVTKWCNRVLAALLLVSVNAVADATSDAVAERIKPVGEVCVQGEDCGAAVSASATAAAGGGEPRSGETVYNTACTACHGTGAGGAPILGDAAAWADRIAQGNDALYDHAINGLNGMPAKGLCMDCSDEEIKLAVDYMAAGSQ
jgi:cytochrome c5